MEPSMIPSLDLKYLNPIYEHFFIKNKELVTTRHFHREINSDEKTGRNPVQSWISERPEIYNYLKKNTYPFGEKITKTFIKVYGANEEVGEFLPLHSDQQAGQSKHRNMFTPEERLTITNTIILYRSDDLEGGEVVMAGDSFEPKSHARKSDTRDLTYRLKILPLRNIGDAAFWHGLTVHGVTSVTRGERISLIVTKQVEFKEEYFKR